MHRPETAAELQGPTYCNGQTLIEHVAFTLSDKLYSYATEEQDLDRSVSAWSAAGQQNAAGKQVSFNRMQVRSGAASMILGNIFSNAQASGGRKQASPSTILATSSSLIAMKPVLDQLSLLYSAATPLVAHVSSLDLSPVTSNLVSDYSRALALSREGGYAVLTSTSAHEIQHMALLATILSSELPTVHTYDGLRVAREQTRVVDVMDQATLQRTYQRVLQQSDALSSKDEAGERVEKILKTFNAELGTEYGLFEYHGAQDATAVAVVFGSPEAAAAKHVALQLASNAESKIGVLNVRVYRPFNEEAFLRLLPATCTQVAVLGQVYTSEDVFDSAVTSVLYGDVLSALAMSAQWAAKRPVVVDVKYTREIVWRAGNMAAVLKQIAAGNQSIDVAALEDVPGFGIEAEQFVQWDLDTQSSTEAAEKVACILATDGKSNVNYHKTFDNYAEGGLVHHEVKVSTKSIEPAFAVEAATLAVVSNAQILKAYNVIDTLQAKATLLLKHAFKPEEFEKKLPDAFKKAAADKGLTLKLLNTAEFGDEVDETALLQLAALKLFRPSLSMDALVEQSAPMHASLSRDALKALAEQLETAITTFEIPTEWASLEAATALPAFVTANSFSINTEREVAYPETAQAGWQTAARQIAFKEAYSFQSTLRPDVTEKTWQVKVQANRRLTPTTYDRNIFHIEFDITGTDLKYDLGESLGVHGHNDPEETRKFIEWYGLDAEDLIQVPSRADPAVFETRTIYQALQQNLDLFGRPGKKFYEDLSVYAEDDKDRKLLTSLGTPEGAVDFKRRAEVETVTYADLLEEFASARPPITELVKLIPPTKRREYSISSSQKVHPNSVHLLVVVVDWKDQRDRERFGHCTRYLSHLELGQQVTVSLKPSVMKLPPRPEQPIVMAGLGTGLAPFRAFVEERAWQKQQGMEIGACMLYLGSRHQKEEYLYGEEWEAYKDAGIITTLGQAFSRDQPQKVYIQDVMRSTLPEIQTALMAQEGSFYLCGPTWPVPDVQEVLEEAIRTQAQQDGTKVESAKVIEEWKEARRFVLEVY